MHSMLNKELLKRVLLFNFKHERFLSKKKADSDDKIKKPSSSNKEKSIFASNGYNQFTQDSKYLYGEMNEIENKNDRYDPLELYQKEDECFLGDKEINRIMSVPKGIPIEQKPKFIFDKLSKRPRGVKISEFTESNLNFKSDEIIELVERKSIKAKQIKQKELTSKQSQNKVLKPKEKVFKPKERTANLTVMSEANRTSEENLLSEEEKKQKITKMLENERKEEKIKIASTYITNLKNLDLNKIFLEKMTDFPLLTKNAIFASKSQNFYDEAELKLLDDYLFNKNNRKLNQEELLKWKFPSVTKVLNATMSDDKYKNLLEWKLSKISTLGIDGFYQYMNTIKIKGSEFHKAVEILIKKETLEESKISDANKICVKCAKEIIKQEFEQGAVLIEENVFHSHLFYQGRMDIMAYYKGKLCVIDWKRSEDSKDEVKKLYEAPVQLAAYLGAFLNDPKHANLRKKHQVEGALVINVTESGQKNFHSFNYNQIEFYWHQWLYLYKNFWYFILQEQNQIKD